MINMLSITDTGLRRSSNQDTYALSSGGSPVWAFVCDGMGGHAGGNIAAETAREILARSFEGGLRPNMSERAVRLLMETAVENAHAAIYRLAGVQPELRGMGTTVVAAALLGSSLYLCHAGDSRAYLLREGTATPLTRDHSVVQRLIDEGEITPKQALTHPERHFITKALGVHSDPIQPDFGDHILRPGDMLLLCSDGLHGLVPAEELCGLCETAIQQGSAQPLADRANSLGGTDNITAVLLYGID